MNWDAIGTIAELIGAAGVILSLAYVGKQLRQTNSTSHSEHVARAEALTSLSMNVACSPHLVETEAKVHYHDLVRNDTTELERIQLGYLFSALSNQLHMGFEQWKEGLLVREDLEEFMGPAAGIMAFPFFAVGMADPEEFIPRGFSAMV